LPDWIDADRHVLIAGPTASGKSALALRIAREQGGAIVNADALQVWSCWRILSARPSPEDEMAVDHRLYGHLSPGTAYSVGHWLREVAGLLRTAPQRLIIVGGTGLYLTALTEGLADIPPTPPDVRARGDETLARAGLEAMAASLDSATRARIDLRNPARVQRAWEVQAATGRSLAGWQATAAPPLLPLDSVTAIRLDADRDWLADRIDRRFSLMLASGAMDEVRAVLPDWDPSAQWARAIGAPELVAHLRGQCSLDDAISRGQAASRQYAKRQRTWFRARMQDWRGIDARLPI
jgi:tRNA dimethylallyltransferase